MKIAVLADIHSNVFALREVVDDAKSNGATVFVNLGDILYGPIAPRATYEYLITQNFITVSGNQDRQICEASKSANQTNPTMQFILNDLGKAPLEWMETLPFDLQINPDIYACHGTPEDDQAYLLEDISSGFPQVRPDKEIIEMLGGVSSSLVLCGHTHIPRCVELSTGQLVINPGSVGLQAYFDDEPVKHRMENYSHLASYVLIQKLENKKWNVSFRKVTYDVKSAINAAKEQSREDWVYYLSTGRCL